MSVAVVRLSASDALDWLPERPISRYPNFVTARGLSKIEDQVAQLQQLQAALEALADDSAEETERAGIERDLRFWKQRRSSARVVAPPATPEVVRFGVTVQLRFEDGARRSFQIVGEDEADPPAGLLSWTSPLGSALIGRHRGDVMEVFGRSADIVRIHI